MRRAIAVTIGGPIIGHTTHSSLDGRQLGKYWRLVLHDFNEQHQSDIGFGHQPHSDMQLQRRDGAETAGATLARSTIAGERLETTRCNERELNSSTGRLEAPPTLPATTRQSMARDAVIGADRD